MFVANGILYEDESRTTILAGSYAMNEATCNCTISHFNMIFEHLIEHEFSSEITDQYFALDDTMTVATPFISSCLVLS